VERQLGKPFPSDSKDDTLGAICAVYSCCMNDRAKVFRRLNSTLKVGRRGQVQAMVFGIWGSRRRQALRSRAIEHRREYFYGDI